MSPGDLPPAQSETAEPLLSPQRASPEPFIPRVDRPVTSRSALGLRTPSAVLTLVVCVFLLLSGAVLSLTPPWEANDEPSHVQNIETLASGHWYRIAHNTDLESHQAPLYYLLLAGYQKLARVPVQQPAPVLAPIGDNQQHGVFSHQVSQDGHDQRLVDFLRIPSLIFGLVTILFTYVAAERIATSRWTPVVAAAVVAGVPKFVFVSGVINNDNLSNALGAIATAAAISLTVKRPSRSVGRAFGAAGLGALAGALILSKATGAFLAPGLLLAAMFIAVGRRELITLFVTFCLGALAICGWWLVQNQVRYGDPLALHATKVHFAEVFPPLLVVPSLLHQFLVSDPSNVYKTLWYDSGWNQFTWRWFWYLPFWGLAAVGIAGLFFKPVIRSARLHRPVAVLASLAVGALASIWIVSIQTNTEEGRLALMGLPAMGLLIAIGYERLRLPVLARFALPAIGAIGVVAALRWNVVIPFAH